MGLGRFELPTSRLSSARSNQLSYRPIKSCHQAHALTHATETTAGKGCSNDAMDSVGSSEKKEKRRRRSPANGPMPILKLTNGPLMFLKRSDRTTRMHL